MWVSSLSCTYFQPRQVDSQSPRIAHGVQESISAWAWRQLRELVPSLLGHFQLAETGFSLKRRSPWKKRGCCHCGWDDTFPAHKKSVKNLYIYNRIQFFLPPTSQLLPSLEILRCKSCSLSGGFASEWPYDCWKAETWGSLRPSRAASTSSYGSEAPPWQRL